jgi:two-component system nitrate/nitrite response regulator NarL
MSHGVVYNEQILTIAQNTLSYVTTVLDCQNSLIRSGISHILSGTHFLLSEEESKQTLELPILCLIYGSQAPDDLSETVEQSKARWPSARVVLLVESIESTAMLHAIQAGLDGICLTGMNREALIKALELVMLGKPSSRQHWRSTCGMMLLASGRPVQMELWSLALERLRLPTS